MVVGDKNYQLNLSRIAFSFKGGLQMDYLQGIGASKMRELSEHSRVIAEEIKNG